MSYARPPYVPENLTRYDTVRTRSYDGAVLLTRWKDPQGNLQTYPADLQGQTADLSSDQFLSSSLRRWF